MRTLSDYFGGIFPGKVRKIAVNAGLGCPNRDGTKGTRGCVYCNNAAFNPSYAFSGGSITEQLNAGIRFNERKGPVWGYLAYFQAFSNTYGPTDKLIALYEEALAVPGVKGLVLATRPDCLQTGLLDWFGQRFGNNAPEGHPYLLVEIGIESTRDSTLERIGRGHDYACARDAVMELHRRGIAVGAHIILGLPGEDESDWMEHARRLSQLPLSTLKLHQLQVIKGTPLAEAFERGEETPHLFTPEEYAATLRRFIDILGDGIALDRFVSETPYDLLIAPRWGLKPSEFSALIPEP